MRRWLPWLLVIGAVVVALVIGASSSQHGPRTVDERAASLDKEIRCPVCREVSVADSDALAAKAIRDDIHARVAAGQSDADIRGFLVSRYGPDILLKPPATGVAGLVWVLPVVAFLLAAAGLGAAFWRWRSQPSAMPVTPEDRALVERALEA